MYENLKNSKLDKFDTNTNIISSLQKYGLNCLYKVWYLN